MRWNQRFHCHNSGDFIWWKETSSSTRRLDSVEEVCSDNRKLLAIVENPLPWWKAQYQKGTFRFKSTHSLSNKTRKESFNSMVFNAILHIPFLDRTTVWKTDCPVVLHTIFLRDFTLLCDRWTRCFFRIFPLPFGERQTHLQENI